MPVPSRLRRLFTAALPAVAAVAFTACNADYPNSIFHSHTEFNRDVDYLFKILIWLGTLVFFFVEGLLVWAMIRFRRRSDDDRPQHVHGNTTLEILWTAIPAVILVIIAVPTVRTIFRTQAKAKADALQVEVVGHQWWWEFRYPQYKITTANELYLPLGRTVNFTLRTQDVLHSFWIPQMGGKRDLIANHPNYLWFTPDSVGEMAWNGFCVEYCGASHANMRFRSFTVTPAQFEAWAAHQSAPAVFGAVAAPGAAGAAAPAGAAPAGGAAAAATDSARAPAGSTAQQAQGAAGAVGASGPGSTVATPNGATVQQAGFVAFPRERMPAHTVPRTPLPGGLRYNDALVGDAKRGSTLIMPCAGCHMINGNPVMMGIIGPNLTHIGTRSTIGGGLFPNDTRHLARWIKNARAMKPGILMPTLGKGETDPVTKAVVPATGLTDEQIADIVAYLQALK
jgi:cytochrome c oxidase subunit 2